MNKVTRVVSKSLRKSEVKELGGDQVSVTTIEFEMGLAHLCMGPMTMSPEAEGHMGSGGRCSCFEAWFNQVLTI